MRHCHHCQNSAAQCPFGDSCRAGKELWVHILECRTPNCTYPRCLNIKALLQHYRSCQVGV
jgi:hypothetical protein